MLVKKDIFNQVGGFDERYFLYFEENDLCLAVRKMGKKVVYYPEAGIIHHSSKAAGKNPSETRKHFSESRYKFFQKHFGQPTAFVIHSFLRLFETLSGR
jgi:GT2 family glycosyltransferase